MSPGMPHPSQQPASLSKDSFQGSNPFQKSSSVAPRSVFDFNSNPLSPPNPFFDKNKRVSPVSHQEEPTPSAKRHLNHIDSSAGQFIQKENFHTEKSAASTEDDYDLLDLEIMECNTIHQELDSFTTNAIHPSNKTLKEIPSKESEKVSPSQGNNTKNTPTLPTGGDRVYKAYGIVFNEVDFMKRYTGEIEKINLHIKGFLDFNYFMMLILTFRNN